MAYNVLIADDSANIRFIIEKALKHAEIPVGKVFAAGDGHEALDVLAREWVDVVLADLNMPNMGGIELIERMQHQGITGRVPVVIVSTEGRRQVIDWLLSSGAAAFLRKPFAPEELGSLVRSVLEAERSTSLDQIATDAFHEAVEGFAMLVAEKTADTYSTDGDLLRATVAFVGPGTAGELTLLADAECCRHIARSATGDERADGHDALAELANTAAGRLVSVLEGGPYALHPPRKEVVNGDSAQESSAQSDVSSNFDLEGHNVAMGVDVRKRW